MIFTVLKLFAFHALGNTDDHLARNAAIEDVALANSVDRNLTSGLIRDEGASVGREKLVNRLSCRCNQALVINNGGPWHRDVVTGHVYFLHLLHQGVLMHQISPIDPWTLLLWVRINLVNLINLNDLNIRSLFDSTIFSSTIFCICIPCLLCCLCLIC
jgi:hypothetical protein